MDTYKFSTDYESLWQLIQQGHKLAGWLTVSRLNSDFEEVVEIRKSKFDDSYRLGYPGAGFGWETDKEEFLKTCAAYNLKYIEPNF